MSAARRDWTGPWRYDRERKRWTRPYRYLIAGLQQPLASMNGAQAVTFTQVSASLTWMTAHEVVTL